ncbi:hypothetical protein [Desulfospira joergensenii]|uniref:hypothetical protein n=1 Tax=Desulfospira joergensenii TaxID=53329 RepID=UPI0003B7375A|nr:hypothetical protein [Desulfospira joergensenii]
MELIIIIATLTSGLAAVWYFWDKIKEIANNLFHSKGNILSDNFEMFEGWLTYRDGNVLHSDEIAHTGKFCLKKTGFNDPNGGIKEFKKVGRGLLFSGWLHRPSSSDGGPADRLSIEDRDGNGYGFAIRHEEENFQIVIETRIEGAFEKNIARATIESHFKSLRDVWYQFNFQITKANTITLTIDCEGQRVGNISADDLRYNKFHRVAVHGGYSYFVDEIKIRRI